jgi:hypothetical protein
MPDHNIFFLDMPIFRDRPFTGFQRIFNHITPPNIYATSASKFDPLASIEKLDFWIFGQINSTPYNVGARGVIDG